MLVLSLFISLAFAALDSVVDVASAPTLENGPSGTYHGAKTVLGMQIDATVVQQDASHMGLTISGAVNVDCSGEEYTYSNGVITVTNINNAGDCLHDALESAGVTLKGITYDEGSDTITVNVKYLFLNEALTLTHQSAEGEVIEPPMVFGKRPSGTYQGAKTIMGMNIHTTVVQQDASHMHLKISGAVNVDCKDEKYTYANGVITVTNIDKPGDCLHDGLKSNGITLVRIVYHEGNDKIIVTVKVLTITTAIILSHQPAEDVKPIVPAILGDGPSGTYHGEKTVVGMKIDATVVQEDASHMGLTISGAVSVDCSFEQYSYANGVVTLPNLNTDGDCLHDALASAGVTLKSITYDQGADTITVTVKYLFLTEALTLTHQSAEDVKPIVPAILGDGPSGTYHGKEIVIGTLLDATVVQEDASHMALTISGGVSVDCSFEQYSYANGVITLLNLNTDGDCLHDALASAGVTLSSITYDQGADTITVTVKDLWTTDAVTLTHQSNSHVAPAAAPKFLGYKNENPMTPKFKVLTTKINPFYIQKLKDSRNQN